MSNTTRINVADPTEISAPVAKAATALGAGAGTSAVSMTQQAQSFLPHDLGGWLAAAASGMALFYSIHLLGEWYWKKVWRPFAERQGWLKPLPRAWYGPRIDPDHEALE